MDYVDVEFEPVINKENVSKIPSVVLVVEEEKIDTTTQEVKEVKEVKEKKENKIVSKIKDVINKEDEVDKADYEVPEELDKNAPFRKSKYIVDDEDEE